MDHEIRIREIFWIDFLHPMINKIINVGKNGIAYSISATLLAYTIIIVAIIIKDQEKTEKPGLDSNTRLRWQQKIEEVRLNHFDATKYCEDLTIDQYSDWRLPRISELKKLIVGCQSGTDACKVGDTCLSHNCKSESCFCKDKQGPGEEGFYWEKGLWLGGGRWFWSSSMLEDDPGKAWGISFLGGDVDDSAISNLKNVRCVRDETK